MGTHFFWDPVEDNIIQERDDGGAITADYTTEPYLYGDLISQHRDGQSRFFCFDILGSTLALTDSSGNVTDTNAYTAFGERTESTGASYSPFTFRGRNEAYRTGFNMDYLVRADQWSASLGSWLTSVPVDHDPHWVDPDAENTEPGLPGRIRALARDRMITKRRGSIFTAAPLEQNELHWHYLFKKFLEALELRERARLLLAMGPIPCSRFYLSISRPTVILELFKHGDCAPTVFIRHVPLLIKTLIPDRFFDIVPCPPQCICVPNRFNTVRTSIVAPFAYTFWFKMGLPARIDFSDHEINGYRGPCTVLVFVLIEVILEHQWGDCALAAPPVPPADPRLPRQGPNAK